MLDFIVVYLILWWLVLFILLPIGVKRELDVKFGNDPGSPKNTMLKKKFIYTSIITLFLTIIILLIKNEIF